MEIQFGKRNKGASIICS